MVKLRAEPLTWAGEGGLWMEEVVDWGEVARGCVKVRPQNLASVVWSLGKLAAAEVSAIGNCETGSNEPWEGGAGRESQGRAQGKRPLGDGQTARRRPQPARACCAARGSGGGVRYGVVGGLVEGWSGACGRGGASRVHTFVLFRATRADVGKAATIYARILPGHAWMGAAARQPPVMRMACLVLSMALLMYGSHILWYRPWTCRQTHATGHLDEEEKRTVPRVGSYKANANTP
jgi:hypothetical protein